MTMTNREWLESLNKQQIRRRKKTGKIPEFAIYRIYNHCSKEWQFADIISSNRKKVHAEFVKRIGFGAYKWRFDIEPWITYNPLTLTWEYTRYAVNRGGKEPLEGTVFLLKQRVEKKCGDWLKQEHKPNSF